MAETVLSLASSMLKSAASKAATAAAEEISLLMGVRKDIWFMKDELETMQAFLEEPEVTKKKQNLVKVWAKQVQDLSYDIEDCLDEFKVHMGSQRLSEKLKKLKDRHRIALQIRNLKSRVEEVSSRNTRYNLIKTETSNTTDGREESCTEDIRRLSARNIDEAQLVGFDTPRKKLLEMINIHVNDDPARVICVVGTGGLGKTTLARKIYDSKEDISKTFSCCAWIVVSQSFVMTDLLKDMIRQLLGAEALNKCLEHVRGNESQIKDHLASYLTEGLKDKRYFIVLDDLWVSDAWKWINDIVLPRNNCRGSRIIVTTRDGGLAKECTSESLIYHLEPLSTDDATKLLLGKTHKTQKDMEENENLRNMVTQLVKKCGYLPLAIVTLGGILASKKIEEWGEFYKKIPAELESNPSLEATRRMVALSYDFLPSHLKSCFLYLSIFPEDFKIKRSRLVDRWIAEGLVKARIGMTIEEVGESYFDELISRSMIIPSRADIEGVVKSCRVHDIVRDIIVSISREANFVYSTGGHVHGISEKVRHVSYNGSESPTVEMDWSCVRSLTVFGERPTEPTPAFCSQQLRMLRALDLEDARFRIAQKDINNVGLLHHLKYLNARGGLAYSNMYTLPRSIGKLQGLQVLDTRRSHISTLPTQITQLQGLRSLRCSKDKMFNHTDPSDFVVDSIKLPIMFTLMDREDRNEMIADLHRAYSSRFSVTAGVRVPRGISNLKALQILEVVDLKATSTRAMKELGKLSALQKLSVTTNGASEKKCKTFCEAIQKLPCLRSLRIDASGYWSSIGTLDWLCSASTLPPLLSRLKLIGVIGVMPDCFRNLTQLVKIQLTESRAEDKIIDLLEGLPKLMLLNLEYWAYNGTELVVRQGAFQNLRKLTVGSQEHLREIGFEEGASPQMESIQIGGCRLQSGIHGIKHLPNLKEIYLDYGSKVASLGALQYEVDAHPNPNKPVLRLYEDRSCHDLGNAEGSDEFFEAMESLPDHTEENSQAITQTASDS